MESRRNLALEGKRVAVLMSGNDTYGERENEPGTKSRSGAGNVTREES
jgi:hypothetical protein